MHRRIASALVVVVIVVITIIWRAETESRRQMSEVAPGLFVSNWTASIDPHLLQRNRICRVLCLNEHKKTDADMAQYAELGIEHHHFHIPDADEAPIHLLFDTTHKLIRDAPGPVLVHCRAGISRSVTIAAAHLVSEGQTDAEALAQIRDARPIAWPNPGFRRALARHCKKINREFTRTP